MPKLPDELPLIRVECGTAAWDLGEAGEFWDGLDERVGALGLDDVLDVVLGGRAAPRFWALAHDPHRPEPAIAAALGLARALARRGQATLVVDGNDHVPLLSAWAGRANVEGWIDVVRYGTSVVASAEPLPFAGRTGYIMGVGSYAPTEATPAEVAQLLARLRHQADDLLVVLPAGATASLWGPVTDIRIYCHDLSASETRLANDVEALTAAGFVPTSLLGLGDPAAEPASSTEPELVGPAPPGFFEPREETPPAMDEVPEPVEAMEEEPQEIVDLIAEPEGDVDQEWAGEPEEPAESDHGGEREEVPEEVAEEVPVEIPEEEPALDDVAEPVAEPWPEPVRTADEGREPATVKDALAALEVDDLKLPPNAETERQLEGTSRVFWVIAVVALGLIAAVTVYYVKFVRVSDRDLFAGAPLETVRNDGTIATPTPPPAVVVDTTAAAADSAAGGGRDPLAPAASALPFDGSAVAGDTVAADTTHVGAGLETEPPSAEPAGAETTSTEPASTEPEPAGTPAFDMTPYAVPVGQDGWALQVYAFRDSASAQVEVSLLERRGLRASARPVDLPGKGVWWRVYVGSFADRAAARRAMPALYEKLRIDWAQPARFDARTDETTGR